MGHKRTAKTGRKTNVWALARLGRKLEKYLGTQQIVALLATAIGA